MTTIDEFSLADIAPFSIAGERQVRAGIASIDPELRAQADVRELPALLARLNSMTSEQLDHMAYYLDATPWRDDWGVQRKRSVLNSTIRIKQHAGTLAAVKDSIDAFGGAASVTEWWQMQPKGTPHTFRVQVVLDGIDDMTPEEMRETQATVKALIESAKPARSQFEFTVSASIVGGGTTHAYARGLTVARFGNL